MFFGRNENNIFIVVANKFVDNQAPNKNSVFY